MERELLSSAVDDCGGEEEIFLDAVAQRCS